jgi:hypothetical protein
MILNTIADFLKSGFPMAEMSMVGSVQSLEKDFGEMMKERVFGGQYLFNLLMHLDVFLLGFGMITMNTVN